MHIHCFYTNTLTGLVPRLYAFTNKEAVAEEFREARKGLRRLVKTMTKEEFRNMRDKLSSLYIIPEELITRDETGGITKVKIYATQGEVMEFRSHVDAIATVCLGQVSMDTSIFVDDLREALCRMGMQACYDAWTSSGYCQRFQYSYDINFEEVFQPRLWVGNYQLDEFQLFVRHWRRTFFNDVDIVNPE